MPPIRPPLRNGAIFGLFLALFAATFFPVWVFDYGVLDDYPNLLTEGRPPRLEYAAGDPFSHLLTPGISIRRSISEGRPLFALKQYLVHGFVSEIEHLRYVRFLGIVGISLLAWSLYRLLARSGHDRFRSFCVAAITCSTLPFQVWVHWADPATHPFAAALAGFASVLADRAASSSRARKWLLAGGAGVALSAALALYQPAAMFYWVFAAVLLPAPDRVPREVFRRLGWQSAIGAAGLAAAYGLATLGSTLYPAHPVRFGIAEDLPARFVWLLHPFQHALGFAVPSPHEWFPPDGGSLLPVTLLVVIAAGLPAFFRSAGGGAPSKCAVAAFLLFLTFLPFLMQETRSMYRMLAAPSALVVLYAYFGVKGLARALRLRFLPGFVAGAAAIAGVLAAAHQVRVLLVEPQVEEFEFLRGELTKGDLSEVRHLYILQPTPETTLAPLRNHYLGRPSSQNRWISRAMVLAVLSETAPAHTRIPVTTVRYDEPLTPLPGSLVVDLRNLGVPP